MKNDVMCEEAARAPFGHAVSRRSFVRAALSALFVPSFSRCVPGPLAPGLGGTPRLTVHPRAPTQPAPMGATALGLESGRDGILYVPSSYDPDTPAPLLVALHGATGRAENWASFYTDCESRGMIMLAVDSREYTWDRVLGGFGPDVPFIDRALAFTFDRCLIDTDRIALGGFSDGASYALSLGPSNGDIFTHLLAYSPGFSVPSPPIIGSPRVFISHGRGDQILPVGGSRNEIVPTLRSLGYDVTYEEFDGRHELPLDIRALGLDWFVG